LRSFLKPSGIKNYADLTVPLLLIGLKSKIVFVKAKKHLGQHFLTDESIAKDIADALTGNGYQDVLEIGPGMGVLTKYLLQKKAKVTVMELDRESVAYLHDTFPLEHIKLDTSAAHFSVLEGDFLKKEIQEIFQKKQVAIIGNFPYNISTQIVFKTIENREFVPEFAGMFQKEVAKRIAEKEGSKVYGILSVLTQAFFDVEYLFTVPPTVFNPPPKVDSGVIRLVRKKDYSLPVDEKIFFRVVKTAFNQRRKMLRSSLKSFNLSETLKEDPIFTKRPEQLSVEAFISLTQKLIENGI
jgi:16S rRNA (adenine1518-N6/adenine1519-N6)-dimethyltransferase